MVPGCGFSVLSEKVEVKYETEGFRLCRVCVQFLGCCKVSSSYSMAECDTNVLSVLSCKSELIYEDAT